MKVTLLVLGLAFASALAGYAEDQTVEISHGRGQFVTHKAPLPADVVSKGVRKESPAKAKREKGVLRPVTVYTARGPVVTLREFPR